MRVYDQKQLLDLLDTKTINILQSIYQIRLKHMAIHLNCTIQNVKYHLDQGNFKDRQKKAIYQLFLDQGMDQTELILINSISNKKSKSYDVHKE
ncbi:hypothetical protein ACVBAX_06265 [Robertmurraya sp. GLU-23]